MRNIWEVSHIFCFGPAYWRVLAGFKGIGVRELRTIGGSSKDSEAAYKYSIMSLIFCPVRD